MRKRWRRRRKEEEEEEEEEEGKRSVKEKEEEEDVKVDVQVKWTKLRLADGGSPIGWALRPEGEAHPSHIPLRRYPPGKLRITIGDELAEEEEEAEAEEELAKMTL